MNPEEALSLGSISEIVMPSDLRSTLARQMAFASVTHARADASDSA